MKIETSPPEKIRRAVAAMLHHVGVIDVDKITQDQKRRIADALCMVDPAHDDARALGNDETDRNALLTCAIIVLGGRFAGLDVNIAPADIHAMGTMLGLVPPPRPDWLRAGCYVWNPYRGKWRNLVVADVDGTDSGFVLVDGLLFTVGCAVHRYAPTRGDAGRLRTGLPCPGCGAPYEDAEPITNTDPCELCREAGRTRVANAAVDALVLQLERNGKERVLLKDLASTRRDARILVETQKGAEVGSAEGRAIAATTRPVAPAVVDEIIASMPMRALESRRSDENAAMFPILPQIADGRDQRALVDAVKARLKLMGLTSVEGFVRGPLALLVTYDSLEAAARLADRDGA